jgi:hypothetical protein
MQVTDRSVRTEVATFFEPSVKCIVDSVQAQIKDGHHSIKVRLVAYPYRPLLTDISMSF